MEVATMMNSIIAIALRWAKTIERKWNGASRSLNISKSESIRHTIFRPPEEIARLKKVQEDKKRLKDEKKQHKQIVRKNKTALISGLKPADEEDKGDEI